MMFSEADEIAANLPAPSFPIDRFVAAAAFLREVSGINEADLGHQQFDNIVEAWMARFRPNSDPIVSAMAEIIRAVWRPRLEALDHCLIRTGFAAAEINQHREAALRLSRKEGRTDEATDEA